MNTTIEAHRPTAHANGSANFMYEIISDTLEPTYRRGVHSLLCMPVDRYTDEGIYLIKYTNGFSELYRCEKRGNYVECWRDNKAYRDVRIHIDLFNETRLALVVADVSIRNADAMRTMQGARA